MLKVTKSFEYNRYLVSLLLLFSLYLMPLIVIASPDQYNIINVTSDNVDHKWPSINNQGHLVWSQKDGNGFWQVFKCIPTNQKCDSNNTTQITSGNQNHERPVISDYGTMAWFQDNTGGGIGYQIIAMDPLGQQSVVEFSSRNNLTGQTRVAGKYLGMSSNGNTVSYYTFSGITRRMNVMGLGQLPGDFFGYNQPDINEDNVLLLVAAGQFDNSPASGVIYKTSVTSLNNLEEIDIGQSPRMTNGVNPEIVYIKNGKVISSVGGQIDDGSWVDINDSRNIVFEKTVDGFQQLDMAIPFFCTPADDIDDNGNPDNDEDGLCDSWEKNGIDINKDGQIDLHLELMGANPNHKNLFVEVDYMDCSIVDSNCSSFHGTHAPSYDALRNVRNAFLSARSVSNPDGLSGIFLSFFDTPEPITEIETISFGDAPGALNDFQDLKNRFPTGTRCNGYFGTPAERNNPNCENILAAKRQVFRYLIFGHQYIENNNVTTASGKSEVFGDDLMVTLGEWDGQSFSRNGGTQNRSLAEVEVQAASIMHELGHTLGLNHGGADSINCKPNYQSIMNYGFQFKNLLSSRPLDYSREKLLDLNEAQLNELIGIPSLFNLEFPYSTEHSGVHNLLIFRTNRDVDWDGNGFKDSDLRTSDINYFGDLNLGFQDCPQSEYQFLRGHDDWKNLKYGFMNSIHYANGMSTDDSKIPEMTAQEASKISEFIDFDEDGIVNAFDNCPAISNSDQADSNNDGVGDICTPVTGDIDNDRDVDCADIGIIRASFGKRFGQPGFDFRADLNADDLVDIRDLSIVSRQLPTGTKCK